MRERDCSVVDQHLLTADYRILRIKAGCVARDARPGQFVHVRIPGLDAMALRRPFSIYKADNGVLEIVYKVVGKGTKQLANLLAGDNVNVIGPLGNGFPCNLPESCIPVLVAGGYGVAPLSFLARRLPARGILLAGGRSAHDLLCLADFSALNWDVRVSTEDGSMGITGRVTALLDEVLKERAAGSVELFACGPDGMLRAVGAIAGKAGCRAWLSLDKHMACGVGACLTCVQKLRRPDGSVWTGRVCRDGPVFEAADIVWD